MWKWCDLIDREIHVTAVQPPLDFKDIFKPVKDLVHKKDPDKHVYCDSEEYRSSECKSVTDPGERKRILAWKKLCFNCAGPSQHASDCKSTSPVEIAKDDNKLQFVIQPQMHQSWTQVERWKGNIVSYRACRNRRCENPCVARYWIWQLLCFFKIDQCIKEETHPRKN